MLLMIAYTILALTFVLVAVDAAQVFIAQRRLAALADGAALAAAQAVDRTAFYAGTGCQLPLSASAAGQAASTYLASTDTPSGVGLQVGAVQNTVTVELADRVTLPFQGLLGAIDARWAAGVPVAVAASAAAPLLGPACSG